MKLKAVLLAALLVTAGCVGQTEVQTAGPDVQAVGNDTATPTPTPEPTTTASTPTETATPAPLDASVRFPSCDRVVVFGADYGTILVQTVSGETVSRVGDFSGETAVKLGDKVAEAVVVQNDTHSVTVENPTVGVCTSTATETTTETPTPTATPSTETSTPTPTATPTPAPSEAVSLEVTSRDPGSQALVMGVVIQNENDYPVRVTIEGVVEEDDGDIRYETLTVKVAAEDTEGRRVSVGIDDPAVSGRVEIVAVERIET